MSKRSDFRPYVPGPDYPRVAGMLGKDAHEHGAASLVNPLPKGLLFDPWEALYAEPFVGVTTDGTPIPGLFALAPNGAPTGPATAAAIALVDGLPEALRTALMRPVDAREWRRWNNTEMYTYKHGLRLEEVDDATRDAILAVLARSLSERGFAKVRDTMRLNRYLGELVGNTRVLGEWSFNFTIFGTPSREAPWGWQLTGHHLVLNCLFVGAQMVLTPVFMGAEPAHADSGPLAGLRLFEDEENRGLALLRSLAPVQRRQAVLHASNFGGDLPPGRRHRADQLHLGGAFQDNRVIPYEGVRAEAFTLPQRNALLDLVQAFVDPLPDGPRKARLDEVERHLADTRFCWIGGSREDDTFYYRVQSPVVMIEFDHHAGVYLTNTAPARFHVHTIVRTPNGNDYGADLLRQHYRREHRPDARPGDATVPGDHVVGREATDGHAHAHPHPHEHSQEHGHGHGHEHEHEPGHDHGHDHDHDHDHGP